MNLDKKFIVIKYTTLLEIIDNFYLLGYKWPHESRNVSLNWLKSYVVNNKIILCFFENNKKIINWSYYSKESINYLSNYYSELNIQIFLREIKLKRILNEKFF